MIQVANGLYLLKLPLVASALGTVNIYLVRGRDGYLLVDTGWNITEAFESLRSQLAEIGARLEDISKIVVTHVHPDHYGMAARLKEVSRAELTMHRLEKEIVETRYVDQERLIRQIAEWLTRNGTTADELGELQTTPAFNRRFVQVVSPDSALRGGETIPWGDFSFQVLWTPGHSVGHVCLYEPDRRIMLSGDYVLPGITPHISLHACQVGTNPLEDYLRSLQETRKLPAAVVLPGHEQPFSDLAGRIDEIIEHHRLRNSEILRTLTAPMTAYRVATRITWMSDKGGVRWESLPPLDRRLAVLETLSHLEYLRWQGRVDSDVRDGLISYHVI